MKKKEERPTRREREFARRLLDCPSARQAALECGLSEESAEQLLQRPRVRALRDRLLRDRCEELGLTRHAVALEVHKVYERCMEKTPVMEYDKASRTWHETGVWQFNPTGALRALSLLGAMVDTLGAEDGEDSVETLLAGLMREEDDE